MENPVDTRETVKTLSLNTYAYRLNTSLNLTRITLPWNYESKTKDQREVLRIEFRHEFRHSEGISNRTLSDNEKMFYPLYKVNKWLTNDGKISVQLDHGVKSLDYIKLVGYSVFNKRQVGFQSAHEMIADDWVALYIDEVQGGVVSNNATANGAFSILHVGGNKDNETGAIEFHQYDPNGLHIHNFDKHQSTVRNLNMRFLDRQGNAAHFGRIHLWFKLCVHHG